MSVDGPANRLQSFGRDASRQSFTGKSGRYMDPVASNLGISEKLDEQNQKLMGPEETEAERMMRLQEEDEARRGSLRNRITAMFGGADATKQFSSEEDELAKALRGQYTDDLEKRYGAAERAMRFGAANTGNIGSTTFADASGKLTEENQLGATRIEEAVRRAIAGLRTAREDSRLRAMGLVDAGTGEEAVQAASSGLRLAAENARASGQEQIFNDLFGDLAYTKAAGDSNDKNAAALAYLARTRGSNSFFPTSSGGNSGRIIQTG
jgi:hypothetical protein